MARTETSAEKLKRKFKKYDYFLGASMPSIPRLQSGIFSFDLLTGGGIPLGRFTEIYGDKSTGKSTFCLRMAEQYLNLHKDKYVLYVDFEQTYDSDWAEYFISEENIDRVYVMLPDYGEEGIDFLINACKEPEIGLVIIDSLAMIIPTATAEADIYTQDVGLLARLVNSMFRKILPIFSRAKKQGNPLTFILLNQVRVNIKASGGYGSPVSKPAGKMQDALVSMDIHFYTKGYKKEGELSTEVTHAFTIEKNKVGGHPKRSGEFKMCLIPHDGMEIGDIYEFNTIIVNSKKAGILGRNGNIWTLGTKKFRNLAEVEDFLRTNPKAFDRVREKTLETLLAKPELLLTKGE